MRVASLAKIVAVFAVVAALLPMQALSARHVQRHSALATLQSGVLYKLNLIRKAHGLVPLKLNSSLSAAAAQHSNEMVADGYFAHNSFDGSAFWKRIQRFYPSVQYRSWSVGENLLWEAGNLDAKRALEMWMASPEHKANILTARWREIGIAAVSKSGAPGVYGGSAVTVVATDFGTRA